MTTKALHAVLLLKENDKNMGMDMIQTDVIYLDQGEGYDNLFGSRGRL